MVVILSIPASVVCITEAADFQAAPLHPTRQQENIVSRYGRQVLDMYLISLGRQCGACYVTSPYCCGTGSWSSST